MTQTLVNTFRIVRRKQEKASQDNATRRDDNRAKIQYETSDPVLYYDPQAVSGLVGTQRTQRNKEDAHVPSKWRFPWSGPHPIVGKKNDNVYYIYHQQRKIVISANVDSLSLYHPFKPLPWDPINPDKSTLHAISKQNVPPAIQRLRGPKDTHVLQKGDYCLVHLKYNGGEPITVMQFLQVLENNRLEFRWVSNYRLEWYIDRRMRVQTWKPGWWQASLQQSYYKTLPLHPKHVPFTNTISGDVLTLQDVIISGFQLQKNYRLPPVVADMALEFYGTLKSSSLTSKPRTYEAKDNEEITERFVQCACPLAECRCVTDVLFNPDASLLCDKCTNKICITPCPCKGDIDTFDMFQCDKCRSFLPVESTFCPQFKCEGTCHKVSFCQQCRRRQEEPPVPHNKRRKTMR